MRHLRINPGTPPSMHLLIQRSWGLTQSASLSLPLCPHAPPCPCPKHSSDFQSWTCQLSSNSSSVVLSLPLCLPPAHTRGAFLLAFPVVALSDAPKRIPSSPLSLFHILSVRPRALKGNPLFLSDRLTLKVTEL